MSPLEQIARLTPSPSLQGELFCYARGRVAFESPTAQESSPRKCILLGGLSDGLMPVPYVGPLESVLVAKDWSLVQPILSSSYTGFGHGSLDRDVQELDQLIDYLVAHRECDTVAMVGHSTGTQDIVHYIKHGREDLVKKVSVVALQAPVSDREASTVCPPDANKVDHLEGLQTNVATAKAMRASGNGDEMMPRSVFWAPITANRFLDLNEFGGRDDYFSSDFSDQELRERLSHLGSAESLRTCLVVISGADEYVPSKVDSKTLLHRFCQAIDHEGSAKAIPLYITTGNHNLSSRDGADSQLFLAELQKHL